MFKHITHLVLNEREAAQLAFGDANATLDTEAAWQAACYAYLGIRHVLTVLRN